MTECKSRYALGCSGHINLARIKDFAEREDCLRFKINSYFEKLKDSFEVTLYSGLANGADSLFAQEALKQGLSVVAVLPKDKQAFAEEQTDRDLFERLFEKASEVIYCDGGYVGVMNEIIERSDEIVTLWDGVILPLFDENNREINRGGTYDVIRNARLAGKKVTHFN